MPIRVSPDEDEMAPNRWCTRRGFLAVSHGILMVLAVWYWKLVAWDAAEACYVDPCYEGPGLEELWKVNKGVTFAGKSEGVLALIHAACGYGLFAPTTSFFACWSRRRSRILRDAHFVAGIFGGATACAALFSLSMVWVWGAETNLLLNLSRLRAANAVFEESGRHMFVRHALVRTFLELGTLSSALCFVQLSVAVQLVLANREFARQFRLLASPSSGGGGDDYDDDDDYDCNGRDAVAMMGSHHHHHGYQHRSETLPLVV